MEVTKVIADVLTLAFLHINPVVGQMQHNADIIADAMNRAKTYQVDWVLTPELALTGYYFYPAIGSDWVNVNDPWIEHLQQVAARNQQVLFLSHLQKRSDTGALYNSLWVIDRQGKALGQHYKINTIPKSEDWSTPGDKATVLEIDNRRVGLLICADAWHPKNAAAAKQQGAEIIISSANWGPGDHGPGDTWENRSRENNMPLIVNNRTGREGKLDFSEATSVISVAGERIFAFQHAQPHMVIVQWHWQKKTVQHVASIPLEKRR